MRRVSAASGNVQLRRAHKEREKKNENEKGYGREEGREGTLPAGQSLLVIER